MGLGDWLRSVAVRALNLRLSGREINSRPRRCRVTTLGKLFTPTCLCRQAVKIGTGQRAMMPFGWEGNRRSGVAVATRHRPYEREMSTPSNTPLGSVAPLYLYLGIGVPVGHRSGALNPVLYATVVLKC